MGSFISRLPDLTPPFTALPTAMTRLEGDLHRLTIIVSIMFCLFIVCFIGLAVYACSSYRKACRRRKTADLESNSIELKKIGAKVANGLAVRILLWLIRN